MIDRVVAFLNQQALKVESPEFAGCKDREECLQHSLGFMDESDVFH